MDAQDVVYATIDDGLITRGDDATSRGSPTTGPSKNCSPTSIRETFWRVHRSYLVNINRIKEVVPWFKSSYQLRMDDKKQTEIPVSRVQTKRLRELLKLSIRLTATPRTSRPLTRRSNAMAYTGTPSDQSDNRWPA